MASPVLRTSTLSRVPTAPLSNHSSYKPQPFPSASFPHTRQRQKCLNKQSRIHHSPTPSNHLPHGLLKKFLTFGFSGDSAAETAETQTREAPELDLEENSDGSVGAENAADEGTSDVVEDNGSAIITALQYYREALTSNDDSKVAEIEAFLKSIEDEKADLERKVASLTEELSYEKERVLRISADFDNFRKRTERERLSLVTNAQGEVVEKLLPVLDNFERAKAQIKVETEGEEKINNSYQSISKQFVEILGVLGVVPVETVGIPFDPLLHEAIMREDSTEYEEGVVIEEFRKGFKLGERLLRPSMVKVSAGPGPAKPTTEVSSGEQQNADEKTEGDLQQEGGSETAEEASA